MPFLPSSPPSERRRASFSPPRSEDKLPDLFFSLYRQQTGTAAPFSLTTEYRNSRSAFFLP